MKSCKHIFTVLFFISLLIYTTGCNREKKHHFTNLPSSSTNVTFTNKLPDKKLFNILYYLYYYNGGGVAVGDINKDGLTDIFFTANTKGNNKLYLNKGDFKFEDITAKAGVAGKSDWASGVTMADVNGDGLLDVYVCAVSKKFGLNGFNELYINNGNNTFTEKSKEYGLDFSGLSQQAAFFDYDRDGDLDCYLLNQSYQPHQNVVDTIRRHKYDTIAGDRLYMNDLSASGKFIDASNAAGIYQSNLGYGLGLAIADMNNDGWDDIYIGNDFHENDYYYINNANGTFTESGAKHFRHYSRFSMGNDVNDYNNDGQPDVVTVDMLPPDEKTLKTYGSDENPDIYNMKLTVNGYQHQVSRNCLQRNNGNGTSFSDVALMCNVSATDWSWAPLFADFDNDGRKDLFVSSGIPKRPVDMDYVRFVSDQTVKKGLDFTDKYDQETIDAMPEGSCHPFFFKNNTGYSFSDVSNDWGTGKMKGFYNGAAYSDLDNDGDLDMVINALEEKSLILRNNTNDKRSISFSFSGDSLNKFGLGTKIYLFSKEGLQYQQLTLTRGFQSSVEPKLFFGLGTASVADSVLVVWPDQKFQLLKNIAIGKTIELKKADAQDIFSYAEWFPDRNIFTPVDILSDWKHKENDFYDFNIQYLIPHKQSTRGPKVAVADINNDGLDDMYVCGGRKQPGALFVQQPDGRFAETNKTLFEKDAGSEDVDAVFFDANGDKQPDLLVTSGGNEVLMASIEGADKLYINDGKGNFSKAELAFPIKYENKSCIAYTDIDKDGDNDFFIGNLASQTAYGQPMDSYLYLNDGNGKFDVATRETIFLQAIGMVTSAAFADVNNDTWPDLVVTGEWMPLKIFINNKGKFTETAIPQSTGLWQCLLPSDVNGDGFVDFLAGNWGHNSKLWSGKNGPLKLYLKDFDNNGAVEQILCYTIDGKEYTFLAKDELERSLPVLKKAYLRYSEVAGKTVQYLFYDLFKDYQELKAEILSSSCFINDGKGNFTRVNLPDELQVAPVMTFAENPANLPKTYVGAGNFYGVTPYEGRYDGMLPTAFSYNKQTKSFVLGSTIPSFDGEARDIRWLNMAGGNKVMVIARNNNSLLFYKSGN